MAVIGLSLEAHGVVELDRFLEATSERAGDLRGAWPATDAVFSDILEKQFDSEGSHGGRAWRQLSEITMAMRANRWGHYEQEPVAGAGAAHPILQWTGRLRDSLVDREHPDAVSEHGRLRYVRGTRVEYAAAHQTGSKDGRLPARPILFLSEEDRHRLMQPIRNWVTGHDPWAPVRVADQLGLDL